MVRVFRLFPSIDDSLSPLLQLLGGSKFRKLRSETGKHNVTFMRIENEYTREEIMNFCCSKNYWSLGDARRKLVNVIFRVLIILEIFLNVIPANMAVIDEKNDFRLQEITT